MTGRQRVLQALRHEEPDRIPIDLGAMMSTGIMGIAYNALKEYLGLKKGRTRMYDLMQQLAEPEPAVLETIGADVVPLLVNEPGVWKPSRLPDGSSCEVPEWFEPERQEDGSQVLRDTSGRITARMPADGYYFDNVYHPLKSAGSIAELREQLRQILPDVPRTGDMDNLHERAQYIYDNTEYAVMLNGAGSIYESSQGLRGWDTFMMDLAGDEELAGVLLDELVDSHMRRLEKILPAVEGLVQIIQVGDDLGMQDGPQLSPALYRKVVKPRHKRFYGYIKKKTASWETDVYLFLHTCGSVYEFIPDFIEAGVDILNPVQVSARDMNTARLKKEFGDDISFWGGGCDTQHVLPFGTPQEVEDEVISRIENLASGGGFIFNQCHNIQSDVPPENIMAMYKTVEQYGAY